MKIQIVTFFISMMLLPSLCFSQSKTVNGFVYDSKGIGIPGATVLEKGTKSLVITSSSGAFSIVLETSNPTLTVSYIGYKTMDLEVANKGNVNFTLVEEHSVLDAVVVVGYGKTSGKEISGSVTSLNEKEFNKGAITSVAQMIQGKVAGVYFTKDGNPASGGSLIIRGTSTLRSGAQDPLYVIDGVPSTGSVAPEDIVSIDILKDASSTAIYGSRAANGVIMITTRQGISKDQSYASFSSYVNIENVSKRYEMMGAQEYKDFLTSNGSALEPGWDDGSDTDWQKEIMRTAVGQNYYFNIGGATNGTKYDAAVSYLNQPGIIKTTETNKLQARVNVERSLLNNMMTIGVTTNGSKTSNDLLYAPNNVYRSMLTFTPTVNGYNSNQQFLEDIDRRDYNPLALIDQNTRTDVQKLLFGSIRAKITPFEGLNYNAILSYQNTQTGMSAYNKKETMYIDGRGKNGRAIRNNYESTSTIFENFINYNKDIQQHKIELMAGYSWQEDNTGDGFQTSNINFMSDATQYFNLGLGSAPEGYNVEYGNVTMRTLRMISFYGRVKYNYANRYIFQASLRNDGSSAFGKNSQWGLFPSISGAWRVISEDFMQNQQIFSDLKLKAGFGISGNSLGFDPMTSVLRYGNTGKFYYQGKYINGIGPVQNENPDLKWEKTSMINLGLDMAFFRSRLSVGVEYYNKLTSDLIWAYDVPATQYVYQTLTANVGKIRNKGIELTIHAKPIIGDKFSWNTSFTAAHNKNIIESLSNNLFKLDYILTAGGATGAGQSGASAQIIKEGYALGTFNTLIFKGFNDKGQSLFLDKNGNVTESPQAPDDYYIVGDAQPKLNYSWSNNFKYNNWDLNFMFRGVAGHKVLNATLAKLNYTSRVSHFNMPQYVTESQQPFGDIRSHFTSDRYIEKADFLRLENITLGYTFKINNQYLNNINAYCSVSNVFTITKYKGIDPEVSMSGIEPGIDSDNLYPKTRSFQIGLKLNF